MSTTRELADKHARCHRASCAKHAYGPFSIVKIGDCEQAIEKRQCLHVEHEGEIAATAILNRLKAVSSRDDFAQRKIEIPKGSILVKAFGYQRAQGYKGTTPEVKLLKHIAGLGKHVWLELYEEDDHLKSIAESMGWVWVATQVKAGSSIKGLYVRGDLAEQTARLMSLSAADKPCIVRVDDFREQAASAASEIAAVERLWADHYSVYNKQESWHAVALKGYKRDDATFIIKPREMSKKWRAENPAMLDLPLEWTELADQMPKTVELARAMFDGETDRVRLMRLSPGGELARHTDITDRDAGVADGKVVRLHVPLVTDEHVRFSYWTHRGEHRTTRMQQGLCYYLDQRKPHMCRNESETERVHLVIDCVSNASLRDQLANGVPDESDAVPS